MKLTKVFLLLFTLMLLSSATIYAQCEGGTVETTDSLTTVYTCPGDGVADSLTFQHITDTTNANYVYVITDTNGVILGLPTTNGQNFEGAGAGTCLVWGLAFTGNLTAMVGDTATAIDLSDDCFDLSDNFITVIRDTPDGGTVATASGDTTVYTCATDGVADVVEFSHSTTSNARYAYVITDLDGNILGLPQGNSLDFDGAGAGICLVWGLSYTGNITAQAGDNALQVNITDDCFDLSDNSIMVVRTAVDGGTVSTDTGADTVYTCASDGVADVVTFAHETSADASYAYVVTDLDGNILGLPPGNSQDFDGAGAGTCLVWGLSYTGSITAQAGDNAMEIALSDSCFELSSNAITVIRSVVDGGTVSTDTGADTVYTCASDGVADVVTFAHETSADASYAYVITDLDGNILGLPPGNSQDFDGAGAGTCLVWGLSYTGSITAQAGDNAMEVALSDDCFELSSSAITVIRNTDCVTGFTLIDADTDMDLMPLNNGDMIDLAVLGVRNPMRLNIRADITGDIPGSVVFGLNDNPEFSIEQIAPYALGGDDNGNYHPTGSSLTYGEHTVTARPYSSYQGMGTAGTPLSVTFTIVPNEEEGERRGYMTEFSVYPNPTDREVIVDMPEGNMGPTQIRIFNQLGDLVQKDLFEAVSPNWYRKLNVANLPAGIYIIQVSNGNLQRATRLVKNP